MLVQRKMDIILRVSYKITRMLNAEVSVFTISSIYLACMNLSCEMYALNFNII